MTLKRNLKKTKIFDKKKSIKYVRIYILLRSKISRLITQQLAFLVFDYNCFHIARRSMLKENTFLDRGEADFCTTSDRKMNFPHNLQMNRQIGKQLFKKISRKKSKILELNYLHL